MSQRLFTLIAALCFVTAAHAEEARVYPGRGVVQKIRLDAKTIVIQHEAFSNYMGAMTMPFQVVDTNELRGIRAGDAITFNLHVTSTHGWVDGIRRREVATATTAAVAPSPYHFSASTSNLDVGDSLPDYHFTNELGQAIHLAEFRGRALAITFFFTSCPYPDYCPRMTSHFSQAATALSKSMGPDAPWQLLSVSFDPQNDTPSRLRAYAEAAHYEPSHWSFLTGDPAQIRQLADNFGETYYVTSPTISHNLRTVVIDTRGQVREIFPGNAWSVDALVKAMTEAAKP